jgi:hypothetical protein
MNPTMQAMPMPMMTAQSVPQAQGFDVSAILRDRHIHIQHHSLIDAQDPLLVVHPDDIKPENAVALTDKIRMAYKMDYPTFFADANKAPFANMLASMIPLSEEANAAIIARKSMNLILQRSKGVDPQTAEELNNQDKPFAAVISQYLDEKKDIHRQPEMVEQAKNAVGMYLVIEQALRQRGYAEKPYQFAYDAQTPDALAVRLSRELKVSTPDFENAAKLGGVAGVGRLLGVSESYLGDVARLTNYLSDHAFSANAIQSWKMGGEQAGMAQAGVQERIDAGLEARIETKVKELSAAHVNAQTPPNIAESEQKMLAALRLLPPELSEALYLLKTEFAYTPEVTVEAISPKSHAYGFNRRVTEHPDDVKGVYQIFVAAKHDAEEFSRVVVHEAHHLLLPNRFTKSEVEAVDALSKAEMQRLGVLKNIMDTWKTGDEATRQHVMQQLNSPEFSVNGKTLSQSLQGASAETFYNMVQHAHERLQIGSETYRSGGYGSPESRFQEINSRYAELRYVRLKDNPDMLQFIVPNTTAIYEQIYMPHVRAELQDLRVRNQAEQTMQQQAYDEAKQVIAAAQISSKQPCCANGTCKHHTMPAPQNTVVAQNIAVSQVQVPPANVAMNF